NETAMQPEVVLDVKAHERISIVLELSRTLPEGEVAAIGGQFARLEIRNTVEAELGRLEEFVIQIDAAAFDHSAETQIVLAFYPAYVVAPGEVVANEAGGRVVAEAEEVVHPDLLDCFDWLKGKGHTQVRHADCISRRP